MSTSQAENEYAAAFDPKEYLDEYYVEPNPEDRFGIRFMIAALRDMPRGLLALEFGGGPTLYAVAALAPQAREIHFCDYVAANLAEVRRWLDGGTDAFDWRPYIKTVLEEEGGPTTPGAVARRAAEIRRKVTRLTGCDASASAPLGRNNTRYDLVVARDCTDVAAATVPEWIQIVRNLTTLVAPGGRLLISVTTGTSINIVGQKSFPCVNLTAEDMYHGYMAAGYDPSTFYLDKMEIPGGREYKGAMSAIARKLNGSPNHIGTPLPYLR